MNKSDEGLLITICLKREEIEKMLKGACIWRRTGIRIGDILPLDIEIIAEEAAQHE